MRRRSWAKVALCLSVVPAVAWAREAPSKSRILQGPPAVSADVLPPVELQPILEAGSVTAQPSHRRALALTLDAPIFSGFGRGRRVLGALRRGNTLDVRRRVSRLKCWEGGRSGHWYQLKDGGYVCSARDFRIGRRLPLLDQRQPDRSAFLPYTYGRVRNRGALRLASLPEVSALQDLAASEHVKDKLFGDYLVAMDSIAEVGGERFVRTVRGHYLREDDLEVFAPPAMRGERLGARTQLPLAFVYGDEAPLYCLEPGAQARECGSAQKHARFEVRGTGRLGARTLVKGDDIAVDASRVRVVRRIQRPRSVERRARWIHVDLSEQALVAYEGDTPVYATLVSTGKKGFSTPPGLYRTERKYLTKSMRGRDPVDGVYDVEEVPWVLFYFRGYALHGAYWHDDFGKVRSHGCTNLAPPDARWLFDWASPTLPRGWHSTNSGRGLAVYFTR